MGKKIVYIILCLSFLIILSKGSFAQYIIAGQHGVNDVYTDVVPDDSLQAWLSPFGMEDSLKLDIDHDGHYDFKISVNGFLAMGGEGEGCDIAHQYTNEFIDTHYDSTYHGPSGWAYCSVPNIYNNGDTINSRLRFAGTGGTFSGYGAGGFMYVNVHDWDTIGDHYVAIKMIVPNDTLYGWIRVNVNASYKIKIKDYACNRNPNTIYLPLAETILYPNPASTEMQIVFNSFEPQTITIYTIQGALLNTIYVDSGSDTYYYPNKYTYTLDTGIMDIGMYLMKIESAKETIVKKFIVMHNKK